MTVEELIELIRSTKDSDLIDGFAFEFDFLANVLEKSKIKNKKILIKKIDKYIDILDGELDA